MDASRATVDGPARAVRGRRRLLIGMSVAIVLQNILETLAFCALTPQSIRVNLYSYI